MNKRTTTIILAMAAMLLPLKAADVTIVVTNNEPVQRQELVEVNASLQLAGGTAFGTGPTYWSSTENSEVLAWTLSSSGELDYFHYNYYGGYRGKATSRSVRGVRAF